MNGLEHRKIRLNGNTIHYFAKGSKDNDLIVFLHGAYCDHSCFNQQIDFFSTNYRVIALDMLGHGLSQLSKSKDKIDTTVEHIKMIMEDENKDSIHIVG